MIILLLYWQWNANFLSRALILGSSLVADLLQYLKSKSVKILCTLSYRVMKFQLTNHVFTSWPNSQTPLTWNITNFAYINFTPAKFTWNFCYNHLALPLTWMSSFIHQMRTMISRKQKISIQQHEFAGNSGNCHIPESFLLS